MELAVLWDLSVKTFTLLGGALAFSAGIWQYSKAQQWRRAEWVAQEFRSFSSDPLVQAAARMIDWSDRRVRLFTDASGPGGELIRVNDDMVARALQHHSMRPAGFDTQEAAIRDCFDQFLDGLERFEAFRKAGLVTPGDLKPHVAYWIHHIRAAQGSDPTAKRLVQLREYISSYGYVGVQTLFACYRRQQLLPSATEDWASCAAAPVRSGS